MKDTTSRYWVQACMYQKRNCIDQWKMVLTMYGYCLQLKPERQEPSENSQSINQSPARRQFVKTPVGAYDTVGVNYNKNTIG